MTDGEHTRATIARVAQEAGVSISTVDRVLNRRAAVRSKTAERVYDAAVRVGFHAHKLLGLRLGPASPSRRLGFLLLRRSESFYRLFASELVRATREVDDGRHEALIEHLEDLTPAAVAEHIIRWKDRCDALAIVAADHPKVNSAIETLAGGNLPVFAMLSDVTTPSRAGFIGIDHRKAGRTAGWVMCRLAQDPGPFAIVLGHHRYLGQELRESSFRSFMRESAPQFRILEPLANFENARFAHESTLKLLRQHADLAGVFIAGGGVEGVIQALREHVSARRITVVCNELVEETRAALTDGVIDVVIATPIAMTADQAVSAMLAQLEQQPPAPKEMVLPFSIYTPENM